MCRQSDLMLLPCSAPTGAWEKGIGETDGFSSSFAEGKRRYFNGFRRDVYVAKNS